MNDPIEQARQEERAAIVKWLQGIADENNAGGPIGVLVGFEQEIIVHAIERGDQIQVKHD